MDRPAFYDVFISYSHKDLDVVLKVAEYLTGRGASVFLDVWEVVPSRVKTGAVIDLDFGLKTLGDLLDALSRASAAVLFHGPGGCGSWVRTERLLSGIRQAKDSFPCFDVHIDDRQALSIHEDGAPLPGVDVCDYLASALGLGPASAAPPARQALHRFEPAIGERADFGYFDITPTGDLLLHYTGRYLSYSGNIEGESVDLVTWDTETRQFQRHAIFWCSSSSSHDHSSGWSEYTDKTITRIFLNNNILELQVRVREERENEWIAEHEVLEDRTDEYRYDTTRRAWLQKP